MAEIEDTSISEFGENGSDELENNLKSVASEEQVTSIHPVFKKYRDAAIPVSKALGGLWKSRRDAGLRAQESLKRSWDDALRYYNNNQMDGRRSIDGRSGNDVRVQRINRKHTETENIVFATINSIVPSIYAKNPTAEFTPAIDDGVGAPDQRAQDLSAFARCCEKLINTLSNREHAPGLGMKVKAKQAVINAQLTNESWMEYGYTLKDQSSEAAMQQLSGIAAALSMAKDETEIKELEGQLLAMEETIDALQPEGPFVRYRPAGDVVVDPDSVAPDHRDAAWIMYKQMFSTSYLNAVYGERDEGGQAKLIFKPTHVLAAGGEDSIERVVNNFTLLSSEKKSGAEYGYNDEDSFRRAQRTLCWIAWDKVTRRVMLYHNDDWTWPMWVWDDPYGLPGFFPLEKLAYVIPPTGARAMGETSYYLDQQDAINENNTEMHRMRQWAAKNIFYDKNKISPNEFEAVMKGGDGTGRGVTVPEGTKLSDHIFSLPPPSINYMSLFDVQSKIAAIDRITGTSVIMRNEQFKTNTTNEAIGVYTSANQTRLDDKIDTTEDWIGRVLQGVTMLCVKFMPREMVAELVGERIASAWRNMEPREFYRTYPMRIEGGSTQKPTSSAKKKEALSMSQILGQFASATPAVLEVVLKVLERAFDEVTLTQEDWQHIRQSIMMQLQRGMSTGAGGPGGPGGDPSAALDNLPPQAKQAFLTAVSRGAPAGEALQQIMGALQRAPQGNA